MQTRIIKLSVIAAVFGFVSCTSDFEKIPDFETLQNQSKYCLWNNDNFNTCSPIAELNGDTLLCVKHNGTVVNKSDCPIEYCKIDEVCDKIAAGGMGKEECSVFLGEIVVEESECPNLGKEPEPPPPPPPPIEPETWPKYCIYSNSCSRVDSADKVANECTGGEEEAQLFDTMAKCLEFTLNQRTI